MFLHQEQKARLMFAIAKSCPRVRCHGVDGTITEVDATREGGGNNLLFLLPIHKFHWLRNIDVDLGNGWKAADRSRVFITGADDVSDFRLCVEVEDV